MKFKFKKIRFDLLSVWKTSVVAFLLILAVLLFLNISHLYGLQKEENLAVAVSGLEFEIRMIKQELLESVIADLEKKEEVFSEILIKKPYIKDPSL